MCGVIGVLIRKITDEQIHLVSKVLLESRIRGKHATGVTYLKKGKLHTLKYSISADLFLKKHSISDFVDDDNNLTMIAHCRYSTSDLATNQPLDGKGISIVHNGVITQEPSRLWRKLYGYKTETKNDTELLLRTVEGGKAPLTEWKSSSISAIEIRNDSSLRFYRNGKRPLYATNIDNGIIVTSTRDIIRRCNKSVEPVAVQPGIYHTVGVDLKTSSKPDKTPVKDLQPSSSNDYYARDFTWGFEIEWGDVDRKVAVPEKLGAWEFSERDIVNSLPPYANVCADPLGIDPPVGGEINTKPTGSWSAQVDRILQLKKLFEAHGSPPTVCSTAHGHIHVHVPGLTQDIPALKRLISYIKHNQKDTVEGVYGFVENPEMKTIAGAKAYLKYDGGRLMPEYMCDNIIRLTTDLPSFFKLHAAGKDGVSAGRPFRYAINTYCLKHISTVEFRCFRGSLEKTELEAQFRFVELFMTAALNGGPTAKEILASRDWSFPPLYWNKNHFIGWKKTKWGEKRGKKVRQFYAVGETSEN